jgi:simple sugar transport system substrate-binding protein
MEKGFFHLRWILLAMFVFLAGYLFACASAPAVPDNFITPPSFPTVNSTTIQSSGTSVKASPAPAKWCSNVHIVFFPGGPANAVFSNNVFNGAKQAEADLGPKVEYVFSDWDPLKMIAQFREVAATKPDGIAIMGHPSDEGFDPLIEAAESNGIIVTSQNTELPKMQQKYGSAGFGYVGAVNYSAGLNLGKEAVRRFSLKSGNRAMVWGLLSQPTRGLRTHGIIDALKENNLTVDYIEIDSATNKDATAGIPIFVNYVKAHPDVRLIVTDHAALTAIVESYVKAAGKKPGEIHIAGFDLSPGSVAAIRGGWLDLIIDQQPWLQGYLPILQICLTKVYGFSGLYIDTSGGFATKDNIEFLAPLAEKEIR